MRTKLILLFSASVPFAVLAGCSSASKKPVYSSSQVGQMISEQPGEVIDVQDVIIKAQSSQAGSAGVGSRMGSAAVVSAALGNPVHAIIAAGDAIGGAMGATLDNQRGEEITILLKDGQMVKVVQQRGDVPFTVGEKVKILSGSSSSIYSGATTQVTHDDVYAKRD